MQEVRTGATLIDQMIFYSAKARTYRQAAIDFPESRSLYLGAARVNEATVLALAHKDASPEHSSALDVRFCG